MAFIAKFVKFCLDGVLGPDADEITSLAIADLIVLS
jgi:hypothetical protein